MFRLPTILDHDHNSIFVKTAVAWHRAHCALHAASLSHGGGYTGWSRAWVIAFWARLKEGNLAGENLVRLLDNSTAVNLFDLHSPDYFQIDGNFGATAALVTNLFGNDLSYGWPVGFARFVLGSCNPDTDMNQEQVAA